MACGTNCGRETAADRCVEMLVKSIKSRMKSVDRAMATVAVEVKAIEERQKVLLEMLAEIDKE